MYSDPIADFLTRIRNGVKAGKTQISAPYSKLKEGIGQVLEAEGFIEKCRIDRTGKFPELMVTLKEDPISLQRVSTPGRRVYRAASDIRPVKNGYGIAVLSTSKGILTGEKAKQEGVGGELLCEIF